MDYLSLHAPPPSLLPPPPPALQVENKFNEIEQQRAPKTIARTMKVRLLQSGGSGGNDDEGNDDDDPNFIRCPHRGFKRVKRDVVRLIEPRSQAADGTKFHVCCMRGWLRA